MILFFYIFQGITVQEILLEEIYRSFDEQIYRSLYFPFFHKVAVSIKKLVFGCVRMCYEIGPDYRILNRTSIIFIKLELHRYAPLCNSQINVKTKASKNIIQSIHSLANL